MGKMIDLTGQKFCCLTVIGPALRPKSVSVKNTKKFWLCRCDCGNQTVVGSSDLRRGKIKSCGCLHKHGLYNTRLYKIHRDMKQRCYNSNNKRYKNYGGRGIKVCDEWLDKENGFINFYNWAMTHGYSDDLSIDRIDVDGNYEPSNCRFADDSIQMFNRRIPKNNTSGHVGVYKTRSKKYATQIVKNRKLHYLGTFATLEEAIKAREQAERKLYPECTKEE